MCYLSIKARQKLHISRGDIVVYDVAREGDGLKINIYLEFSTSHIAYVHVVCAEKPP